jgi:hypothetical protein
LRCSDGRQIVVADRPPAQALPEECAVLFHSDWKDRDLRGENRNIRAAIVADA